MTNANEDSGTNVKIFTRGNLIVDLIVVVVVTVVVVVVVVVTVVAVTVVVDDIVVVFVVFVEGSFKKNSRNLHRLCFQAFSKETFQIAAILFKCWTKNFVFYTSSLIRRQETRSESGVTNNLNKSSDMVP